MLFFTKKSDGGSNSGVSGFWLIEIKPLFSIVFLKFTPSSRINYHSHAFNAITWFIRGKVVEEKIDGSSKEYRASAMPKFTPRSNYHKIHCDKPAWAFCIRGPWDKTWQEYDPVKKKYITLTKGRKIV